jgi:hypothetical protein
MMIAIMDVRWGGGGPKHIISVWMNGDGGWWFFLFYHIL